MLGDGERQKLSRHEQRLLGKDMGICKATRNDCGGATLCGRPGVCPAGELHSSSLTTPELVPSLPRDVVRKERRDFSALSQEGNFRLVG